jgi:hypothetical protein
MLAEFSACLFSVSIFCLRCNANGCTGAPLRQTTVATPTVAALRCAECGLRTTRAIGRADLPIPAYGRLNPTYGVPVLPPLCVELPLVLFDLRDESDGRNVKRKVDRRRPFAPEERP